jgi:DNA polymerase-1
MLGNSRGTSCVHKPRVLVFDIETNGFYHELDRVHSLVIKDPETGDVYSCSPAYAATKSNRAASSSQLHGRYQRLSVEQGLQILESADVLVGHNIVAFDLPALWKVYPEWGAKFHLSTSGGLTRDTMLLSRLFYTDMKDRDMKRKGFPGKMTGKHSLESWGYRLGNYKGDYTGGFDHWSQEMQDYCEQDVEVSLDLWNKLTPIAAEWGIDIFDPSPAPDKSCIQLEHDVARIVARQEKFGFAFDVDAAQKLAGELFGWRAELENELQHVFPPQIIEEVKVPKVSNKTKGWVKGVPMTVRTQVIFNPGSRQQVGKRLRDLGWNPTEFTADGHPKISDETLAEAARNIPAANVLADYFLNGKRLGMLATGDESWLKAERKGRIHGGVVTNGAVTGRMTHFSPNLAQVPGVKAKKLSQRKDPFQAKYRALFRASLGVLVGCDADALELRDLAGYMALYDGGAYIKTVLEGKKEEGTDMHTLNAKALGCDRETAKTWFYAFIYGAGDYKLGLILNVRGNYNQVAAIGKQSRAKFLKALPALGKLTQRVQERVKRGYVIGLDGRRIFLRSEHAALNSLLQGAGAIQMKMALVILDNTLQSKGYQTGRDYEFVVNVHDEIQTDTKEELADFVGRTAAWSIEQAGVFFNFRCPLKGNYVIGRDWSETH